MANQIGIRFKIGELFGADEPLARWVTVCAMALNDLLLVNRWLVPNLEADGPDCTNVYLARLGTAHLYEASKFLNESERRLGDVRTHISGLEEDAQEAYERIKAVGPGGSSAFSEQLEHARNHFFHYPRLVLHAPEYEELKRSMDEHRDSVGEIHDPGRFIEFRARFADDIGTEISFPDETVDLHDFVPSLSAAISDYFTFAVPAIVRYIESAPSGTWEYIDRPAS